MRHHMKLKPIVLDIVESVVIPLLIKYFK